MSPSEAAGDYLSFRLGSEEYGIRIRLVQELRNYAGVTTIAGAPPWVRGVVNLRGVIVPIVDLRVRFALGEACYDDFTVVIILTIGDSMIGVVVDSVSDVITLASADLAAVPALGNTVDRHYLLGAGKTSEGIILLLDIARMLAADSAGLPYAKLV